MSTGQIFLTLGAVTLLLYMSLNINRMRVSAVEVSVESQREMEVISCGQSLSEWVHFQSYNYNSFISKYDKFDDINDPATRSKEELLCNDLLTSDTLYSTIEIKKDTLLIFEETGSLVSIDIYDEIDGEYIWKSRFSTAITPIGSN